jgi:prevent-host-death family protein
MRDHSTSADKGPTHKQVGVRELKANAARILREVRDSRASYILTHRGRAVGVILPLDPSPSRRECQEDGNNAAAWEMFVQAGRRLEQRFRPGLSGVRILSQTRR